MVRQKWTSNPFLLCGYISNIAHVSHYTSTHSHLTSQSSSVWSCRKSLPHRGCCSPHRKALFPTLSIPNTQINASRIRCMECVFPPQADCVQLKSRSTTESSKKPSVLLCPASSHTTMAFVQHLLQKEGKKRLGHALYRQDQERDRPQRTSVCSATIYFMPEISMTVIYLLGLSKF